MPHFTLSSPRYSVREPSSRSRDTLPYEEEDEDDNEGEAETPQADGDGDHCGLSEDGDNSSDGDSEMVDANDAEDEDEYAQFSTDLEKYQYDQKNFARPTTKKGPKSKSKALPKKIAAPRKVALPKKGKSKQTSRANALQSPPLKLGIDFNPTGDMWYTHHIRGSNGKRVWLSRKCHTFSMGS